MTRVVIDTNVFISSFFGGNPKKVIDLWKNGKIALCLSRNIVDEYIEVLKRMGLKDENELEELLGLFAKGYNAGKIKDYLITSKNYNKDSIQILRILDDLLCHGNLLPAHIQLERLIKDDKRVIFNIAGGMNFQVAAILYSISTPMFDIVYPEDAGIHKATIDNGRMTDYTLLPLPHLVNVLSMQGLEYEVLKYRKSPLFGTIDRHSLTLPQAIYYVKVNNIIFNCVCNSGNSLIFFKVLLEKNYKNRKNKRESLLDVARSLLAFAETRVYSGDLLHRKIIVLTDISSVKDRLEIESRGKIKTISDIRELTETIKTSVPTIELSEIDEEIYLTENKVYGEGTVYISLGKDILPALIALFSHRPARVVFFYTPEDKNIERNKSSIIKYRNLLPVKEVSFSKCSIFGSSIYNYPVRNNIDRPHGVNITSGTKGHCAFLTLLAKKNGLPVFSIKTDEQKLEEIPSGAGSKLTAPEPLILLLMGGQKIPERGYGITGKEIIQQKELYEGILAFLSTIPEDAETKNILTSGITTPGGKLLVYKEKEEMKIVFRGGNKRLAWSSKKNEWFEDLIGYIMIRQGAEDVRVRILTGREDDAMALTEIDVVARFGTSYFVISCKAGKTSVNKDSLEIAAVSRLFGRFAIPIMARLQYSKEPYRVKGVYHFGFRTFTDREKMQRLLEEARLAFKKSY